MIYEKIEKGIRWRPVCDFEGYYEVSDTGLFRKLNRDGSIEKYPKIYVNSHGYPFLTIEARSKKKITYIHTEVARAFLYYKADGTQIAVVDHVDGDKLNNNVTNLRIITNRRNAIKGKRVTEGTTSKHAGVYWHKSQQKWYAKIRIKKAVKYLGSYDTEAEAVAAYLKALKPIDAIECRSANMIGFDRTLKEKYVSLHK